MAYGLQTYLADGSPQLTITDRLTRYISSHSVSLAPQASQFISVPGMSTDGTWCVTGYTGTCFIIISTDGFSVKNASANTSYSFNLFVFRF